jgi:putative nucleotidyltransferase with HDIG domain
VHLGPALIGTIVMAVSAAVRFDTGYGYTAPMPLGLVPLCALVPARAVPVCVAAAVLSWGVTEVLRGRRHFTRLLPLLPNCTFALGPAVVLAAAGGAPLLDHATAVVVAAIAAQPVVDILAGLARCRAVEGRLSRGMLAELASVEVVDAGLGCVGVVLARGVVDRPALLLLVLPLMALLSQFARERRTRLNHLVELNAAYRGTALLLGDVVEADDAYTGEHCRDVVQLTVSVADELGLSSAQRREVEFGALLHDVGKVAIPKEIINKPGPLDDEEWAIMRTHTIEGERMLRQVGGVMADVARVVRASHERWDGGGYPDGLAGEAIPLAARIVACCDAFNAMTTDRSYRRALPLAVAIGELHANAGTQFDPHVVDAVLRVVDRPALALVA